MAHISAMAQTLLAMTLACIPLITSAQGFNTDEDGALIHGFDVISYFDGTPEKGDENIAYESDGFKLYFSSELNLSRYRNNPDFYNPGFGGYCAYGVRMGKKLDIDPEAWAIHDDRLYFLLDRSTKMVWDNERSRNIGIAERLWPTIKSVSAKALEDG